MNRLVKCIMLLLLAMTFSMVTILNLALAGTPVRGAGPSQFHSHPSAHAVTGAITVGTPANAYDALSDTTPPYDAGNTTSADVVWGTKDGTFDLTTFTTPSWGGGPATPSIISQVDLKINWEVIASSKGQYRVYYQIDGTTIDLVGWGNSAFAKKTDAFSAVSRPGGGSWTWADIGALKVKFQIDGAGGASDGHVYVYEVWASVLAPADPEVAIYPTSMTNQAIGSTVTYKVNITDVFDLGGVELKVKYNPNVINITHPWVQSLSGPGNITTGPFFPTSFLWFNASGVDPLEPVNKQYIWVSFSMPFGTPKGGGKSGTGFLMTMNFKVTGTGYSDLIVYDVNIGDSYALPIPRTLADGSYGAPPVPEFPLGLVMEIAIGVSIAAIWLKRKRGAKTNTYATAPMQ